MNYLYKIADLEKILGMNRMTIYRWIKKYEIYHEKNNKTYIFSEKTIEELKYIIKIKNGEKHV